MCSTKSWETWRSLEQEVSCSVVARGIQGGDESEQAAPSSTSAAQRNQQPKRVGNIYRGAHEIQFRVETPLSQKNMSVGQTCRQTSRRDI